MFGVNPLRNVFRRWLPHAQAEEAQDIIRRLLLGETIAPASGPSGLIGLATKIPDKADAKVAEAQAQKGAEAPAPPPAPSPPPPPPPPPPPSVPAGWHPDPMGRHEHRYWDGSA